eukprot:6482169-Prymnesium_polylepis.1
MGDEPTGNTLQRERLANMSGGHEHARSIVGLEHDGVRATRGSVRHYPEGCRCRCVAATAAERARRRWRCRWAGAYEHTSLHVRPHAARSAMGNTDCRKLLARISTHRLQPIGGWSAEQHLQPARSALVRLERGEKQGAEHDRAKMVEALVPVRSASEPWDWLEADAQDIGGRPRPLNAQVVRVRHVELFAVDIRTDRTTCCPRPLRKPNAKGK